MKDKKRARPEAATSRRAVSKTMWIDGRPKPFDANIILRERQNVKENRCRNGGELFMTTTIAILGVTLATLNIMKLIEALDAPNENRRKRA